MPGQINQGGGCLAMNEYIFLISLAIILLTTKILGDVTNKVNMTQVVGALLAGVLIGPSCLDWVTETDFVEKAAEIYIKIMGVPLKQTITDATKRITFVT